MEGPLRVLGIDPGGRATGWGLVESRGGVLSCAGCGTIRAQGALPERLRSIHARLGEIIARYHPDEAAFEEVFLARNFQSALSLGEARGVALLAAAQAGLPVFEYSAAEVKKAVTGYGRADKAQVQAMVRRLLSLPTDAPAAAQPAADAADALAVAICHHHSRQLTALGAATP